MKHLVKSFVCATNVGSHMCIFIFRHNLLQQCLILRKKSHASGIPSCNGHGKRFFACLFLDAIKC